MVKQFFTLALLTLAFTANVLAQCTTSVDAGMDQIVCTSGSNTTLNALINGDFFDVSWSPTIGLTNPNAAGTTVTLDATTTYTVAVRSFSTDNLIINGDFSLGDQDFTSDYIYGTGGGAGLLSNEGQYAIDNNAGNTHNQFANCSDHTGGGNMMVINASGDASNIWCQTVSVDPGTEYAFSAWVTSVVSQNPAILQFSINGTLLGSPYNASAATCSWNQFFETWDSGTNNVAEICIANVNFDPAGNDLALDDISFSPVCLATDEVTITVADLNASWTGPSTLCTGDNPLNLNDLLDSDATPGGQWTVNGLLLDAINPNVLPPGSYLVEYTVIESLCSESFGNTIQILQGPTASFMLDQMGYCVGDDISITFNGSATAGATFNWDLGPLGTFTGPGPINIPAVVAGNFNVNLTVADNGCTSPIFTGVIQVDEPPFTDLVIDCNATTTSVEFTWPDFPDVTFDVAILSGQTGSFTSSNSYLVDGLGQNEAVAIQVSANFQGIACSSASFQAFCTSISCPNYEVTINAPAVVCSGEEVLIDYNIVGSNGPFEVQYLLDGNLTVIADAPASNSISLTPIANIDFEIISVIDNSNNECPVSLPTPITVIVEELLSAGFSGQAAITCSGDPQIFNLFDLIEGEDLGGSWSEAIMSTDSAFNASNATFNTAGQAPGFYIFFYIHEATSACPETNATATIIIEDGPLADAGQDMNLSCGVTSIPIGGNSTQGPYITYTWTSPDGGQLDNPNVANPNALTGGTFILTVVNTFTSCSATDEIIIIEGTDELSIFTSQVAVSCDVPNSGGIQVDSVQGGIGPYQFSIDGGIFGNSSIFSNLPSGNYTIEVQDVTGCQSSVEVILNEPTSIIADIVTSAGDNNILLPLGESLKLDLQIVGTPDTIIWSPEIDGCDGCQTPLVSPSESTIYIVTVIDENGCTATDAISIFIEEAQRIFIPNVFSPNDDGLNDIFYVNTGAEVVQITTWEIIDRWGNQVFSQQNVAPNDPSFGWDGEFKGRELNPGVFVYYIELELQSGNLLQLKGEVSLLR